MATKQLRRMSAKVYTDSDAWFITAIHCTIDGEKRVYYLPNHDERNAHTLLVLESYSSIVAIFDCDTDTMFLLPRWNYSVTTQKHLRAFCNDYLNANVYAYDLKHNIAPFETVFADGYENGTAWIQQF